MPNLWILSDLLPGRSAILILQNKEAGNYVSDFGAGVRRTAAVGGGLPNFGAVGGGLLPGPARKARDPRLEGSPVADSAAVPGGTVGGGYVRLEALENLYRCVFEVRPGSYSGICLVDYYAKVGKLDKISENRNFSKKQRKNRFDRF